MSSVCAAERLAAVFQVASSVTAVSLSSGMAAGRRRLDGAVAVEQIAATRNPEPTFVPPTFTPLPSVRPAPSGTA
jgi:hypothetical protein